MMRYALGIFAVCLVCGLATLLSHSSGRAERIALGIISLYIIVSPIADGLSHFDADDWLGSLPAVDGEIDSEYTALLEEAFTDGIRSCVAEKYSLDKADVRVRVYGFDSSRLSAERIRVILSGGAIIADYKAVEKYLNSLGLGECDVEIEIG